MNGVPREDGFDITVASEVMAILCLSKDIDDLKERLGRIVVGFTREDKPVTCADLKAQGAMAALLKDAMKPNLVQTLEHSPVFIHGGPFANIAHGCNSIIATRMAMKFGDYAVTEAGFGADLGAEKFFDIKCRTAGLRPDAVVVVATIRALKYNGGVDKYNLTKENTEALRKGLPNLMRHVENIKNVYELPVVVAINAFATDTEAELKLVQEECLKVGVKADIVTVWAHGGAGGEELAKDVVSLCDEEHGFALCYDNEDSIEEKIEKVVKRIYHGKGVDYTLSARKQLARLEKLGFGSFPVCIAKTQYSFSDDAKLLGAPEGFRVTVRQLKVSAGAGFIVAITGNIMTMPGLPKVPAAEGIDVDSYGNISGLF